jgi:hypothetical protein
MTATKELYQKGVNIRSIVGGNLPAQVTTFAHWSPRSSLRRGAESYLHGIKYSPFKCHFVQLVVSGLITGSCFGDFDNTLQKMTLVVNFLAVRQVVKSRCSQSMKIRWLSRPEALSWLPSREAQLFEMNFRLFPEARRFQFQGGYHNEQFSHVSNLSYNSLSLYSSSQKLFCHVYSALKTLKTHFRKEEKSYRSSYPEYAAFCLIVLSIIQQRQCKLLDKDLLKAAFWLTCFAFENLSGNVLFIPIPDRLDLEYRAPCPVPPARGPLDGIWDHIRGSQSFCKT